MPIPHALRSHRWPVLICLTVLLGGYCLGAWFGASHTDLRASLIERATAVADEVYGEERNPAMAARRAGTGAYAMLTKAHTHATGLGTAGVAAIIVLALAGATHWTALLASSTLTIGVVGYPSYWLVAGWQAPVLGGESAAREHWEALAILGAGGVLIGTAALLAIAGWHLLKPADSVTDEPVNKAIHHPDSSHGTNSADGQIDL